MFALVLDLSYITSSTYIDDYPFAVVVVVWNWMEVVLAGILRILVDSFLLVSTELGQFPKREKTINYFSYRLLPFHTTIIEFHYFSKVFRICILQIHLVLFLSSSVHGNIEKLQITFANNNRNVRMKVHD